MIKANLFTGKTAIILLRECVTGGLTRLISLNGFPPVARGKRPVDPTVFVKRLSTGYLAILKPREELKSMRREVLTWEDVDKLIDHLIPQFEHEFDAMVLITRGGITPGGMLAEALQVKDIFTAAVDFPAEIENEKQREKNRLLAWPKFLQFPDENLVRGRRVLIIDDVWGSGRTITAVKNRITGQAGVPYTCVLHFNPYRSLFGTVRPDYYAAITDAFIVYPWEIRRGTENIVAHKDS